MKPFLKVLSSLELTIGCLAFSMVLIFFGTIDQVNLGIYGATQKYFYSLFVYQDIPAWDLRIPYLPGGYLVGLVMLANLITSMTVRFRFSLKKIGIWAVHLGLILLLLGEFISSVFQEEANMTLDEGQTVNFTESFRHSELAIIDTSAPEKDTVYAIPERMMEQRQQVEINGLPFVITIDDFLPNSQLAVRDNNIGSPTKLANRGIGLERVAFPIAETGKTDERNIPSAVITLLDVTRAGEPEIIGTWLLREFMPPQNFTYAGKSYSMQVRRKREYLPYSLTLLDFSHDRYLGTNIPKNFSSEVVLSNPENNEEQNFLIYMNNPLRYADLTFYQHSFMEGDTTSILQVVRNPGRHLPYISCTVITLGLLAQFGISLFRYAEKRKKTA